MIRAGNGLALLETVPSLVTILQHEAFECRGGKPVKPFPLATLIPQGGVHVAFRRAPISASDSAQA